MKLIKKILPILLTGAFLIGCSKVNAVKPKFSKFENEISLGEFTLLYASNKIVDKIEDKFQYNGDNLNKGIILSTNQSIVQTLSGDNSNGNDISYKKGESFTSTFKYDQKSDAGLQESNEANETTSKGVNSCEVEYDDGYYLDVVESSSLDLQTTSTLHELVRTQYKDGYVYEINQIDKEYTKIELNKSFASFDRYIGDQVANRFALIPGLVIPLLLLESTLDFKFYSDNDDTLITIDATKKGSLEKEGTTYGEYDVSLRCQLDLKNCSFGYAKTTNIKQSIGKQNIKYVETVYYTSKIEFQNVSVVQANLNNFTLI